MTTFMESMHYSSVLLQAGAQFCCIHAIAMAPKKRPRKRREPNWLLVCSLPRFALARDFLAFLASLGKRNCDRLLAALDFASSSAFAALCGSAFVAVHFAPDFLT
jgi:hypothetical protein